MSTQEQQQNDEFEAREASDIPEEERAKEVGDDEDAEKRSMDDFEAVRPWRVAKSLDVLLKQVNAKAPNRDKKSDGASAMPRTRAETQTIIPGSSKEASA